MKESFASNFFLNPEELKTPPGLPTGFSSLDHYLLWNGIPKGALSRVSGLQGTGKTSLWMQTARPLTQEGKMVAWIESSKTQLNPWFLRQQKLSLKHLFWISSPKNLKEKLWVLQELCHLDYFEIIGCPLEENEILKDHQLLRLKKLARRHHVALVLLARTAWTHPHLALSLHCQKNHWMILRALHRPTPHPLERRELYAHTLSEFASERKALGG